MSSAQGPIENWRVATAWVRNRVVHAGHEPDLFAARRSVNGTKTLETFIADRVTDPQTLVRYPRTALKLLGEPGLRRLIRWSRMDLEPWVMPNEWRPQYRVIPLAGVMINNQDIDGDLGNPVVPSGQ